MTREQIDQLSAEYRKCTQRRGAYEITLRLEPLLELAQQALNELTTLSQDGGGQAEIAARLGFVQGVLWCTGLLNRSDIWPTWT